MRRKMMRRREAFEVRKSGSQLATQLRGWICGVSKAAPSTRGGVKFGAAARRTASGWSFRIRVI